MNNHTEIFLETEYFVLAFSILQTTVALSLRNIHENNGQGIFCDIFQNYSKILRFLF